MFRGIFRPHIWIYVGIIMLAAYLLLRTLLCLIPRKKKWWSLPLLFFGCWLIISMIIFVGDIVNLPPALLVFLLCVWFGCEGSGWKRTVTGLMLASTVLAFNGFCDNCLLAAFAWADVEFTGIFRLAFALLLFCLMRGKKTDPAFELSEPLWRLMLMLTFLPLFIVISLVLFRSPRWDSEGSILADGALFLVAVFGFGALLRALFVLEHQQRLEREMALAEQSRSYYETLETQQFEVRRLKHDLANHLQTLLGLPEERRTAYIEGMLDGAAFGRVLHFGGDATVNAVLTAKESRMQQKGIRFHARVEIAGELPFEKPDVCALFSNALDNAIEACLRLRAEEEKQPEITLTARFGKGVLAVRVENPCEVLPEKQRNKYGQFPTSKADAKNHGFGLRSISEVVKKYGGTMEITSADGRFSLFLWIPQEGTAQTVGNRTKM